MKTKRGLRNQYGLALWIKILLGLFATGLLIAVAVGIIAFTFVKDATDPKKTKETANKIATLADPLPAPFVYGQVNLATGFLSLALINDTSSKAVYVLIKSPRKDASDSAQAAIEKVASGEAALPSASGSVTTSTGTSTTTAGGKFQVGDKGSLDVAGEKMTYVKGKASSTRTAAAAESGASTSASLETFFGGLDNKDGKNNTYLMVQETDPGKTLTMDEVKKFTDCIKAFP